MGRPLLVTNDFLPDVGGIQQYVAQIAARLPDVGVFAPANDHADDHTLPYPVWRGPRRYLWPTPAVLQALRAAIAAHDASVVVFMAPAPLSLLGPALDRPWAVCTHGAELVLPGRLPGLRQAFAAVLRRADRLYTVSDYTGVVLARLVGATGPAIVMVRNGVDPAVFHPGIDPREIRARHGLGAAPTIVTVGRVVPRKGQDQLIAALPRVRESVPDARLVVVGEGRRRRRLQRRVRRGGITGVVFAGRVSWSELPAYYCAGTVFAHPNRTRWAGLEQEGFGVVFLEAQACGIPVVAGRSGGSPEALVDGVTGLLVNGRDADDIVQALIRLLDSEVAARMGHAAREWIERSWSWDVIVEEFARDLRTVVTRTRSSR